MNLRSCERESKYSINHKEMQTKEMQNHKKCKLVHSDRKQIEEGRLGSAWKRGGLGGQKGEMAQTT
jgi:hypothetical protein